jgi:hypothetical protein
LVYMVPAIMKAVLTPINVGKVALCFFLFLLLLIFELIFLSSF